MQLLFIIYVALFSVTLRDLMSLPTKSTVGPNQKKILHHEELPPARRTILCIYGAVRGVGGIDSWGSNVEDEYCISAEEDIDYSFTIC